jgi:hypothetical protein
MSWEEFKKELNDMFDELEQEVEKHELAESIRKRQPWVLWEGGEEQERQSQPSVLDELMDFFRKLLNF